MTGDGLCVCERECVSVVRSDRHIQDTRLDSCVCVRARACGQIRQTHTRHSTGFVCVCVCVCVCVWSDYTSRQVSRKREGDVWGERVRACVRGREGERERE